MWLQDLEEAAVVLDNAGGGDGNCPFIILSPVLSKREKHAFQTLLSSGRPRLVGMRPWQTGSGGES